MYFPKQRSLLTRRQADVLLLAAEGLSYKEMAVRLGIAYSTVRNYCYVIHNVLGARNTTHAVVIAWRLGLLDLESISLPPRPRPPVEHP